MNQEQVMLVVLLFLLASFSIWIIFELILFAYIKKNSSAISKLKDLNKNKEHSFYKINTTYTYVKRNKSKKTFDKTDFYKVLKEYYLGNEQFFSDIINKLEHNLNEATLYDQNCDMIFTDRVIDWYRGINFEKREKFWFNQFKLKPIKDISILIKSTYTSPKGKNSYLAKREYHFSDIKNISNEIKKQNEFQKSKQYQRLIMTDQLRYTVLKRDNFRCCLCGASAQDGATLHVDHIFPVSKGGKTELSNLRTLCDQCNLGKGAKYDDDGLN